MVIWHKRGRLYAPDTTERHPKLSTHAANPVAVHLEGDVYRVFYSGRDERNRSSVGAVDIDIVARQVVRDHPEPVIEHGPPGAFHADGISIGCVYRAADGERYMLFMGWQSQGLAHWRGDIGRFRMTDDLRLVPDRTAPFLEADLHDPVSLSYPWVERTDAGYIMWYGSTWTWDAGNGEMIHVINHATSPDGHVWERRGLAVPMQFGVAQAFSRPTVVTHEDGRRDMWFSYRGGGRGKYRIGRAHAKTGSDWVLDLATTGIATSADGWDSEMIEYPFVFRHNDQLLMLYNGNGHGESGFGLAEAVA